MERCPLCKTELFLSRSYYTTENDHSVDLPTKVFLNVEQRCRNRQCTHYNRVVDVEKQLVYDEAAAIEEQTGATAQ